MRYALAASLLAASVFALSCSSSSTGPSGPSGTLRMMLKDSPFTDAKALLVTFSEVNAHRSDATEGTWTKLPFAAGATSRTCDLKKLQTAQDVLGTGPFATGHYTQVRLVVSTPGIYFHTPSSGHACAATISGLTRRTPKLTIPSRRG